MIEHVLHVSKMLKSKTKQTKKKTLVIKQKLREQYSNYRKKSSSFWFFISSNRRTRTPSSSLSSVYFERNCIPLVVTANKIHSQFFTHVSCRTRTHIHALKRSLHVVIVIRSLVWCFVVVFGAERVVAFGP